MNNPIVLLLLFLVMAACGEPEPAGPPPAPAPDVPFDPARIIARDWENYRTSFSRYDEVVGRVVDPGGAPVAGAVATLMLLPSEQMLPPLVIDETRADEQGLFRFKDLPAEGVVSVAAQGWAGRVVRVRFLTSRVDEIVDLGLRPGAEVSGRVARVDGSPVGGVHLLASNPGFNWVVVTASDADGRYRIPAAPIGPVSVSILPGMFMGELQRFEVEADTPTTVDVTVVDVLPVEGTILDEATRAPIPGAVVRTFSEGEITVEADAEGKFSLAGAHGPLAFVLAPGYGERPLQLDQTRTETQTVTVLLGPGAAAAGRVETPEGEPIEDARIGFIGDPDGGGIISWGPHTDAAGRFFYNWIPEPPGDHTGYFLALTKDRLAALGERQMVLAGVRVPTAIVLRPQLPVKAHLRLVAEDGKPIVGANVSMRFDESEYPQGTRYYLRNADGGVSDKDGMLFFSGLRPGPQVLDAWIDLRAPFSRPLTLASGENVDLGTIVVPRGGRVAGRVRSTGGALPEDSGVDLSEVGGLFFLSGVIDENGTFEFTGLEDKPYLLRVGARDHESVQVEARVGDELDVVLKLLGTLKVVTVHPEGSGPGGSIELVRMPIGQAGIRPVVRPFARSGDTAEIERVAPGTYVVRVEVEDRKWYGLGEARIRPGQSETVTVEMKRAGRLYGTVSHPDGSPAAEAPVSYEAGELWGTRGVKTDAEGRYSLPGIPEGRVVVRSHPFGFARAVKEVELGPGEEREVDLLLTEGASLSLLVTSRGTGEPVEDVGVALAHETGESARYWIKDRQDARTDGEGRLRMVGISPGRYRLSLYSGATRLDMRVLDLTGVEEVEIAVDR